MRRIGVLGAVGIGTGTLLAACGGGEQPAATPSETPAAAPPAEAPRAEGFTCTDTSGLNEREIEARIQLQYVDESMMEGRNCDNCALWVAAEGDGCGTCQTVKGPIHPMGHCTIWAAMPA